MSRSHLSLLSIDPLNEIKGSMFLSYKTLTKKFTNQQLNLYTSLSFLSHSVSTRSSDSLVLSIAMSDHHWTKGLPLSLVHDSGIFSLIPEIRIFHQAQFQAQSAQIHLNVPSYNQWVCCNPLKFFL